ncbi:MAG TPA: FAD-dependent monooxygenase [Cyclobacteriaceae bacterium]|nr:FAD-dependent monooxygenase [Cyclobacteriaceae bacterium]
MKIPKTFAILGGGIGGLTLAIALQRKGIDVTVYEGAPQWKPVGAGLGLAGNAVKAFREIGIDQDVLREGKVLKKVVIRSKSGKPLMSTDSEAVSKRFGVVNNFTIHRADLHNVLISKLMPGTVKLDKACVDFTQSDDGVLINFKDGSIAKADYMIAADGIHSVARKKLLSNVKTRYAGYTCWRAVTDDLPAGFDPDETSETWGQGTRFGIVPLTKGRVYWFMCVNAGPNDPMMRSLAPMDLLTFVRDFHPLVPELVKRTNKVIWNDIIDIEPINQFAFNKVVLMGDAAHATTPNMGQGACMAIEDAAVLSHLIETNENIEAAFRIFEEKRIRRTTKIVNDSWQIGRMAQWENPFMTSLRNVALSLMPKSVTDNTFKFIYDVSLK